MKKNLYAVLKCISVVLRASRLGASQIFFSPARPHWCRRHSNDVNGSPELYSAQSLESFIPCFLRQDRMGTTLATRADVSQRHTKRQTQGPTNVQNPAVEETLTLADLKSWLPDLTQLQEAVAEVDQPDGYHRVVVFGAAILKLTARTCLLKIGRWKSSLP